MKKENWFLVGAALIIGILLGVLFSGVGEKPSRTAAPASSTAPVPAVNYQQNIQMLEDIVRREPDNRDAWVQLGHNYFDSKQPMKAIEAYSKALALNGNDPNVLTDQGIMFRQVGWFDKAIENFQKANDLNPSHLQSLYNMGVVYRYDLQNFDKARQVWSHYLELNPSGPGADQVRRELAALGSQPMPPAGPAQN